jgi:hypothetical protein
MKKQARMLAGAILLIFATAGLAGADPADPRDYEAAQPYYADAVQGQADAQAKLGALYLNGTGVPQSDTYALQWFLRAAEQGHAQAQLALSGMFANGQGVARHDVLAYKWAWLAESNASDPDLRRRAGEMIDLLARRMPEAEMAAARGLIGLPTLASDARRPAKLEPAKVEPANVEPVNAGAAKLEPVRPQSAVNGTPKRPEAARSEPATAEVKPATDTAGRDRLRPDPTVDRPAERRPGRLARMREELEKAHRTVSFIGGMWK